MTSELIRWGCGARLGLDSINVDLIYGLPTPKNAAVPRRIPSAKFLQAQPDLGHRALQLCARNPGARRQQRLVRGFYPEGGMQKFEIFPQWRKFIEGRYLYYRHGNHSRKPGDEARSLATQNRTLASHFQATTTKAGGPILRHGVPIQRNTKTRNAQKSTRTCLPWEKKPWAERGQSPPWRGYIARR